MSRGNATPQKRGQSLHLRRTQSVHLRRTQKGPCNSAQRLYLTDFRKVRRANRSPVPTDPRGPQDRLYSQSFCQNAPGAAQDLRTAFIPKAFTKSEHGPPRTRLHKTRPPTRRDLRTAFIPKAFARTQSVHLRRTQKRPCKSAQRLYLTAFRKVRTESSAEIDTVHQHPQNVSGPNNT